MTTVVLNHMELAADTRMITTRTCRKTQKKSIAQETCRKIHPTPWWVVTGAGDANLIRRLDGVLMILLLKCFKTIWMDPSDGRTIICSENKKTSLFVFWRTGHLWHFQLTAQTTRWTWLTKVHVMSLNTFTPDDLKTLYVLSGSGSEGLTPQDTRTHTAKDLVLKASKTDPGTNNLVTVFCLRTWSWKEQQPHIHHRMFPKDQRNRLEVFLDGLRDRWFQPKTS